MDLNDKVIEVLDDEHGKKVIDFFKSQGINTKGHKGNYTQAKCSIYCYYGISHNLFFFKRTQTR